MRAATNERAENDHASLGVPIYVQRVVLGLASRINVCTT